MPQGPVDHLTFTYQHAQHERVVRNRERIVQSVNAITDGRVIPEVDDLSIGSGRRLEATVLFLDISKFSNNPAESTEEQELLLRILSLFFTEMIRVLEDYGGVVEKNTGDGLMAYFVRDPRWPEDVRQRALAAALTMFYSADNNINVIVRNSGLNPIQFRICMDHGWVTIARIGAAQRFNNIVAVGTTANVAAKMLAKADPDTILLGDRMLAGLPQDWVRQFVQSSTASSGWIYRATGLSYPLWVYAGRWTRPSV
jgi:adenylate cyclase